MSTACPGAVQVPAGAWDRGGCGCGLSPHPLPWSDSPVSGGGGCGSWEHEKSRRALKWREEQRKESYTKDDSEKDSDTGDDQPDTLEPPEVASARESIAALVGEQKKLRKQKVSGAGGGAGRVQKGLGVGGGRGGAQALALCDLAEFLLCASLTPL